MHCLGGLEHKTTHFCRQILQNYPERAHSFADNFEASVFALSQCTVPACHPSPPTLQAKTLLWTTLKSVLTRGRKYFQKRGKKWRNVHGKTLRSLPRLFLKRAHRRCCCRRQIVGWVLASSLDVWRETGRAQTLNLTHCLGKAGLSYQNMER